MVTRGVRRGASEQEKFREVLGHFASGVVAVTGVAPDGSPAGMAISSFNAVSLDPLLVSFCIGHTSRTWPLLLASDRICINILSEHQQHVSACLSRSGGQKFGELAWTSSPGGLPLLDGALAWLEGTVDAQHRAGDHDIVVAKVRRLDVAERSGPLIHYRGAYRRLAPS
ncbi:flavin reductase family protein [Streptomyces sp. NPDC002044]|uniref:flavin reductase family protein n=1 Tax=Streptomyces sp. NPDC002044 TaxID=3154662 RepID=UPI003320E78F